MKIRDRVPREQKLGTLSKDDDDNDDDDDDDDGGGGDDDDDDDGCDYDDNDYDGVVGGGGDEHQFSKRIKLTLLLPSTLFSFIRG